MEHVSSLAIWILGVIIVVINLIFIYRRKRDKAVATVRSHGISFCSSNGCEDTLRKFEESLLLIDFYFMDPSEIGFADWANFYGVAVHSLDAYIYRMKVFEEELKRDIRSSDEPEMYRLALSSHLERRLRSEEDMKELLKIIDNKYFMRTNWVQLPPETF